MNVDKSNHKQVTDKVLKYVRENDPLLPTSQHGTALANIALESSVTALLILGKSESEILDYLHAGFRKETAERFYKGGEFWYNKIRDECPKEFNGYLVKNAKDVTPKRGRLPKPRKSLPSFEKEANEKTGELATDENGNHIEGEKHE